ncbi:MAG TPA: RNA polymerase sigma-70 factor [Chitinophagaceae bacterium]|nr:RNA polymerase sigma-70 factor [Chitinophagaceae bacterium]
MADYESGLIQSLATRDEAAFEKVFKTHFKALHAYAFTIIKDEAAAEEVVQNIFLKLWERSENLTIAGSVSSYLYRAVYNESLNHIKHQKVKMAYGQHLSFSMKDATDNAAKRVSLKELEGRLATALNELPEQCRTIFQLSRFEELRYREIAEQLQISTKTVENQMGKALKILRVKLADFLLVTLLFSLSILKLVV